MVMVLKFRQYLLVGQMGDYYKQITATSVQTLALLSESKYNPTTLDRRQSKILLTINECGSKIARNSVFNCHLSPIGRQIAIENFVSNYL